METQVFAYRGNLYVLRGDRVTKLLASGKERATPLQADVLRALGAAQPTWQEVNEAYRRNGRPHRDAIRA